MKTLIELLVTCLFCALLYRFGGVELNGKVIAVGFLLWLFGYLEGKGEKKNGWCDRYNDYHAGEK